MSEEKPRKRRGAGRVTLNAVARQAGVSAITVSRYFNQPEQVSPERRERIAADSFDDPQLLLPLVSMQVITNTKRVLRRRAA